MLNINQVRCFIAVATELSFRRAAQSLNMSQPPLTRQIQLLEQHLNITLLNRDKRSVTLTTAGKAFYQEASDLMKHIHQIEQYTRRVASGEVGSVAIGFVPNAFYQYLPEILVRLRDEFPFINISLQQTNTFQQVEAVINHQIDLGIVRIIPENNALESALCIDETFVAAVPRQHALANREALTLEDFDNQPVIMYSISWKPFFDLLTHAFDVAGAKPNYVQYESNTVNILSLVNVGLGAAIVPQSAATFKFDNVVYLPLMTAQRLANRMYFIWRKDNENEAFHLVKNRILN
ncbi:LysR family transcriptional regulator [Kosakonia sp. BYX6]|uniref:LysR family transcriptional regulator n=1 Tax=Kosakonia calanthes TaxID=3139408 RepID=A0ABZ3BB95_9ENTR